MWVRILYLRVTKTDSFQLGIYQKDLFWKSLSEVYRILCRTLEALFVPLSPHSPFMLLSYLFRSSLLLLTDSPSPHSLLYILGSDHPVLIQFQKYPGWSHFWPPTKHSTSLISFLNYSTFLTAFPACFFSIACFIWHTKYLLILLTVLVLPSGRKLCEKCLYVLFIAVSAGPELVSDVALNK